MPRSPDSEPKQKYKNVKPISGPVGAVKSYPKIMRLDPIASAFAEKLRFAADSSRAQLPGIRYPQNTPPLSWSNKGGFHFIIKLYFKIFCI